MKKAHGLRGYFYEYVFYKAVDEARERTGELVPISQAQAIRARVDGLLAAKGTSLNDPLLGVTDCLTAIDAAFGERLVGYEPQFGDRTAGNPRYQELQREFVLTTGVGEAGARTDARLPISPYDPAWSGRATVKRAGTSLLFVTDETIARATGGEAGPISDPRFGNAVLWRLDEDGSPYEAGRAMTDDDAAGLTELMDKMSEAEYAQVRDWVVDGGRDPRTGRIDRNRFMSRRAVARSAAVLEHLKSEGVAYEVLRDREPGQIKARMAGTGMEIRLTDTRQEEYAGARVYDNGTVIRFSTNHRVPGGMAVHSPTPEDAVQLVRFAMGKSVERRDEPGRTVGEAGTTHPERARGRSVVEVPDSYHVDRESMSVFADYEAPGEDAPRAGSKVMIRRDSRNRSLPMFFVDAEPAEAYARAAVESARDNLRRAIDADGLIEAFEAQRAEGLNLVEFEPPELSSDPEAAAIQRTYWDILTGARDELLRPGATAEMYQARLEAIGEQAGDDTDLGNLAYSGSPSEKVRAHAEDVPFELIGTWEPEIHDVDGELVDQRFDPSRVARWMDSPTGQWSNLDNLAAALRRCGVGPEELMGTGFQTTRFKDRIIRFDDDSATPIGEHGSEFVRAAGDVLRASLERNAVTPTAMLIDHQGVIRWSGDKTRRDGSTSPVSGEIGQIFDVGDHGEIVTRFASGDNSLIVPGYEARIAAQRPGEAPTSVEERTILRGYEQLLHERIEHQAAIDVVSGRSQTGEPTSLNAVYSRLYGTKHPLDLIDRSRTGQPHTDGPEASDRPETALNPWTEAILATEARRVKYPNEIKQGSTIYAEYRADRDRIDPADDNRFDAWRLTGGRNMAVLTGKAQNGVQAPGGYFDPVMTGGATNQGIVRYLTQDARVRPDGRIEPGDPGTPTGSRAPLMNRPELETMRYDPFDRQQMTATTIMQSAEVTTPTGTALMTFGGWTTDDGVVVSSEFAEEHRIVGAGGGLRPLVVGDKLSDLHGNKGVISLIVDRNMPYEESAELEIPREVTWFRSNPDLHVVMSPFSLISRRNAGSARELMSGDVDDLVDPFATDERGMMGSRVRGALGQMRFVVTHMAVDDKTLVYDDAQIQAGRGRKASSQLAWALQAKKCKAIMQEFYGHNNGAESDLREYLLTVGLDMEGDGTLLVVGDHEPVDGRPERRLIPMPDLMRTQPRAAGQSPGLNTTAMRRGFGQLIGDRGGYMELPFPLTYPTGKQTEQASDESWRLPVMSSHLRSGQEFDDGSSVTHDYTRSFQDIHVEACRYRFMAEQLESPGITAEKRAEARGAMSDAAARAQRSFDAVTTDVCRRVLSGKSNAFKTGLMASRLSDSATMVWTGDPRLDIDQVAISSSKAGQLGLADGDHALVWRDPVLRHAGVRYLRVTIDDRLTGVAINPVSCKSFDGDFDGDAVAVVKLHTAEAKAEAAERLVMESNLLDTGEVGPRGTHPFSTHVSLDTRVTLAKDEWLRGALDRLSGEVNLNAVVPEHDDPEARASALERNREGDKDAARRLSDFYRYAVREEFGTALIFSSAHEHVRSVDEVCVRTGAKGNAEKLAKYAENLGLRADGDGGTHGVDRGEPGITKEDQEASMFATAIKAHGTGLGGSFSQRAVKALRGADLEAVLEVTYPVTQSILQAKHDADEARHKYAMLQGPGRDLWRGRLIERIGPGQWGAVFEDGEPVQATTGEWERQFVDFYSSKDGFGVTVNPDHVARVAQALEDPATGRIRNLEEDPGLRGSLMDRMAYGGDFATLLEAARARENVFDGEQNEQFCSAPTRRQRRLAGGHIDSIHDLASLTSVDPVVDAAVLRRDVVADGADTARTRGEGRRSGFAVGVRAPRRSPRKEAVLAAASEAPAEDYEMGA